MNKQKVEEMLDTVRDMPLAEYTEFLMKLASIQYHYSWRNSLIIMCYGGTWTMGFHQWKEKYNRTVKKGERAIWILAPRMKKEEAEVKDGEGLVIGTEEKSRCVGYVSVPVFDIKQTEGDNTFIRQEIDENKR